ncbi:MAG: DUF748 domain-containing protein [Candidatus Rokubacteria bacterium]|nr:DUF748 domain-containing protein [Candidatus Rokubacteria bacterium]
MNRRLVLRLLVVLAVALVALVAIGIAALPAIVRHVVVWQLGASLDRPVTLESVDLDLVEGRLGFRTLRITDRDGQPLGTIDRLDARFSPRDLLRGHLRIVDGTLEAPAVRIVRTGPNEFNIADLFRPREESKPGALAITVERFHVARGAVDIEDRTLTPPRVWRLERLTVDAQSVSTDPAKPAGIVTLHTVAAGSPISVWMTGLRLQPLALHATLIARDVDGTLAGLYLPPASPLTPRRATLDVSGTIQHSAADGTRATLDVGFANVELRRPGHDDTLVTAPAVRIKVEDAHVRAGAVTVARVEVDGGTVSVLDTRVSPARRWQAEGLLVEARGVSTTRDAPPGVATARAVIAGSPVSVWVTNIRVAPVELHATAIVRNADLTLFRVYLPTDLAVQPERGVIDATVQVDHDARGRTLVDVDASLRDLELRRPAHFVRAPALRLTAEDIGFDGGAVTVLRAGVTSDRFTVEDRTVTPARTWPVQNLAVEASRLSSRREDVQGVATVRATVAGAAASAWITGLRLDPLELQATAILRDVDLTLARIYLPPAAAVEPTAGRVNASLQIKHSAQAGTWVTGDAILTGLEARARDASGLRASAPSLRVTVTDARHQGDAWSAGRIEVSGSGVLTDPRAPNARFDLERLRVAGQGVAWPALGPAQVEVSARLRDGSELEARGTAEVTAAAPTLAAKTDLTATLTSVDLAPVSIYVPVVTGLGGRVSGRLTASVAYAGALTARVRGDVDVVRLALTDAAKSLVTVRRIQATDLDVQWPERVAMRKLHVTQPNARVDRDRRGEFPLLARFATRGAAAPDPAGAGSGAARSLPPLAVGELVVEEGRVAFVDYTTPEPARINVQKVALTMRDVAWPAKTPARIRLEAALPRDGALRVDGSIGGEPARIDAQVELTNGAVVIAQPYLGLPGDVRGRVEARVAVVGSLAPTLQLSVRGTASGKRLEVTDPAQTLLTVDQIEATGIDAAWPGRLTIDRVRVRKPWARIERDRHGEFLLMKVFRRPPRGRAPGQAPPAGPAATPLEFRVREALMEESAATIVDGTTTPPARIEVDGARLAVQEFVWPPRTPVKLQLASPAPGGGKLEADATLELEPVRLDARFVLDEVQISPAQPYLPIRGLVIGRVSGELAMKMTIEPLTIQIGGNARVQRFALRDGERALVAVGRMDTTGVDVDWPKRIAVRSVQLRRPRLLVERDAKGEFELLAFLKPEWERVPAAGASRPAAAPAASAPPRFDVGTVGLEKASARFVDHTTIPAYAEELTDVELSLTGVTTAPGQRVRFASSGAMPGGSSFKVEGQFLTGERPHTDVKVELRDVVIPRTNPYLEKYTSWTATRGSLTATATYTLDGTQIAAKHEVVVRGLDVAHSAEHDEVEQRLGLPLGFLVSLMKDARGEIKLAVPVAGDLSSREFDFTDAVWSAVKSLTVRVLALPFSRIGSLFVREDSKVEAIAIAPVIFEPGTTELGAGMGPHLDRIAVLLRDKPALKLGLVPVNTLADVEALKRAKVRARLQASIGTVLGATLAEAARTEYRWRWPERTAPEATDAIVDALAEVEPTPTDVLRELTTRRLEAVRQTLDRRGIAGDRLAQGRRRTLVEAGGAGRVELDLRP